MFTSDGTVRLGARFHDLQSLHGPPNGRRIEDRMDDEGVHDFADCHSVAAVYCRERN